MALKGYVDLHWTMTLLTAFDNKDNAAAFLESLPPSTSPSIHTPSAASTDGCVSGLHMHKDEDEDRQYISDIGLTMAHIRLLLLIISMTVHLSPHLY